MKRTNFGILYSFILLTFILITGCRTPAEIEPDGITHNLEKVGNDLTFELVTWNMHNFPDNGERSKESYKIIIETLDIDLYAVQEIASTSSFDALMSLLPGYDGIYSDDTYDSGYQKTGIIYKNDMIEILSKEQIYKDNQYEFPRPPLVLKLKVTKNGFSFDFYLVVIHLKAFEGEDELNRRRGAVKLLKEYMDTKIGEGEETDYIIAGDWNDELTDSEDLNCFTILLNDSIDYRFLTLDIASDPVYSSYPYKGSLIDHILIASSLFDEYEGGSTTTLLIDTKIENYFSNVSDHRPVISVFPVF